jgi:hypothetical protein
MMRDPKTDPIPAPEPATPTVAAPAPMNLAAESMSLLAAEVWRARTATACRCILTTIARPQGVTARRAIADILVSVSDKYDIRQEFYNRKKNT